VKSDELLEKRSFVAISADDEVRVWAFLKNLWDDVYEEIHSFSRGQPCDKNDDNFIQRESQTRVGVKLISVHRIWYGETYPRINLGSQSEVILACMTDTNSGVDILQVPFADFIQMNRFKTAIWEKRMLGYYCFYTEDLGRQHHHGHGDAGAEMPMDDFYLFSQ
jgi:hypothetical protein